ncbi:JAB domain-containing protein [Seohaeicola sp.]
MNASALILECIKPSVGRPNPSDADIMMTQQIKDRALRRLA